MRCNDVVFAYCLGYHRDGKYPPIDFFRRQCVALWTQSKPSNARALSDVLPRTGYYFASAAMRGTVRPRSKLPGARLKKRIYGFTLFPFSRKAVAADRSAAGKGRLLRVPAPRRGD